MKQYKTIDRGRYQNSSGESDKKLNEAEDYKLYLKIISEKSKATVDIFGGKFTNVSAVTNVASLSNCKMSFDGKFFSYKNSGSRGSFHIRDISLINNGQYNTPFDPDAKSFHIELSIGVTILVYP